MCKERRGEMEGRCARRGGQGQAGPRWAAGEERVAAELAQDGHLDLGCCCFPTGLEEYKDVCHQMLLLNKLLVGKVGLFLKQSRV